MSVAMSESHTLLCLSLKIGHVLLQNGSIEQLLTDCCKAFTDSGRFNTAWTGLLSIDQTHFETIQYGQKCDPPCLKETFPSLVLNNSLQSLGMAGRCILENQLIILNNRQYDSSHESVSMFHPWQEYFNTTEVQSAIVLPLSLLPSLKPLGCLMLTSNRDDIFNDDVVLILKIISLNISQAIDLKKQKSTQKKLEQMANFDQLTQLPNRNLFLERFERGLNEAKRFKKIIAVIFMDLDNFKYINDTFGHEIGDVLLVQVAKRLSRSLRKYDLISRFGGDEFIIALPYLNSEQLIASLVEKIKSEFDLPFELSGQSSYITCSMGISIYPESGDDASSLLKYADIAMYKAKEKGRNQFHFFNEHLNHKVNRQIKLSAELGYALENHEFSLLYQPQIELSSGDIVACEALLRWSNKNLGDISPLEFIPAAEQSNLINKIDFWALEQIKCDLEDWIAAAKQPVRVFANFSERGFSDNVFLSKLKQFVHHHRFITRYLGIELTEPVLLKTSEQTNQLLEFLHENDISLALDNFGCGYSSVSHLKNSPISQIKIAKKFIDKAALDGHEEAFINAIIAMSQALNIKTVAVGVEEPQQKLFVEQSQCEMAQGSIYHKPMSADKLKKHLKSRSDKGALKTSAPNTFYATYPRS